MSTTPFKRGSTYAVGDLEVEIKHYSNRDGRYQVVWKGLQYTEGRRPDPECQEMVPAARLHLLLQGAKVVGKKS